MPLVIILTLLLCSCQKNIHTELFEVRNEGIALNGDIKEQISGVKEKPKASSKTEKKEYEPLNYDEQKAIWFSYID